MDKDMVKKEQGHDTSIALIQKDIEYIKNSLAKIDTTLAIFDRNFARKDEIKEFEKIIEKNYSDLKIELSKKVDNSEFEPIKKTLQRINWILISAVVVGVLSLVIKQ